MNQQVDEDRLRELLVECSRLAKRHKEFLGKLEVMLFNSYGFRSTDMNDERIIDFAYHGIGELTVAEAMKAMENESEKSS